MPQIPAVPPHVDPRLVYDFDLLAGVGGTTDPHDMMRKAQREAPRVFFTLRNGGHWVATGRAEIIEIYQQPALFANRTMTFPHLDVADPGIGNIEGVWLVPNHLDPPDHTYYRLLLAPFFSPAAVSRMRDSTQELATKLIDDVKSAGLKEYDFVDRFGTPVPVLMFMTMMAMPAERYFEFSEWVDAYYKAHTEDQQKTAIARVDSYLEELIEERSSAPGEDIVSYLFQAKVNGAPLSRTMIHKIAFNLFLAGLDSVTASLSYAVQALAKDRTIQDRLRAEPARIPPAIEEFFRLYAVPNVPRRVMQDMEFHGAHLRKNDTILMALSVAGMDERAVKDPDHFELDPGRPHIAFGSGPHTCLGMHMARMEMQVFLEEWLTRMPPFRLSEGHQPIFRSGVVNALDELWLVHE